jgi:ABC transport system ATP-binding/permease protein
MFTECIFPGIRNPDFYTEEAKVALGQQKPSEPPSPTPYPSLTPYPSPTPLPTYTPPAKPNDQAGQKNYEDKLKQQGEQYRSAMQKQGEEYRQMSLRQGDEYQDARTSQGDEYTNAMKAYADEREDWQTSTQKAISAAEGKIKAVLDNFGRTLQGSVVSRWLAMTIIMVVVLGLIIFFQKRKDTV